MTPVEVVRGDGPVVLGPPQHYGWPGDGVHAIQIDLAQRGYLAAEAAPWDYAPDVARPLRTVLHAILTDLDTLARSGALTGA